MFEKNNRFSIILNYFPYEDGEAYITTSLNPFQNNVQFGWKSGSKEEDEIVKSLRPRPLERRWIDITRDTGNLFATFSIIVISASTG